MQIRVLFNPRAGSAEQIEALKGEIAKTAGATLREVGPGDDVARLAAELGNGCDVVAVAGGDGTVHAAANGLIAAGAQAALAVVPLGTGNDFCRTMAIPLDPLEAVGLFRSGKVRAVDAVRLSGARGGVMVNAATGGFSGKVAADVTSELKAFWGPLAYLRGAVGTLADPPRYHLTLRFDGGPPETFDALNLVVANARTAAGGLPVAPTADPEDGLLDVVVVRSAGALDLSVVAARLMHGDYIKDENVVHRLARSVEVTSDPPLPLSVDGERCEGSRFTFEVTPRALRVLTGPGYHARPAPEPPLEGHHDAPAAAKPQGLKARLFGLLGGALLLAKRAPRGRVVALGVAAVAVLLFVWLARGVVGERWRAWDARVGSAVRAAGGLDLSGPAVAITAVGSAGPFAALVVATAAVLVARRRYADAAGLLAVVAGVLALEGVLKPLFAVARPVLPEPRYAATGFSFPSGHALRASGFFGYVAFLLMAAGPGTGWRWGAAAACGAMIAGVCWSRVYLGVHHPTDVIAGALAAGAWVVACATARRRAVARPGATVS